jgi:hypothetical protein
MTKRKGTNGLIMIYKTLWRKLQIQWYVMNEERTGLRLRQTEHIHTDVP